MYTHIQCIQYTVCVLFVCMCVIIHTFITLHYTTLHYITYITLHTYMYMGMGQNSVPLVNSKIAGNHPPTNDVYLYIYMFFVCIVVRISAYKTNETRWRQPTSFQTPI